MYQKYTENLGNHEMIFIKEHFDKILEAYDKDYKKMDDAWGNQRDPNNFSKHISSIEPKIPSLQIPSDALKSFGNKKIHNRFKLEGIEIPFPQRTLTFANSPTTLK